MTIDLALDELRTLIEERVRNTARERERRAVDDLNHTVRRLRKASGESEVAQLLVNGLETQGGYRAVIQFEGQSARFSAMRGGDPSGDHCGEAFPANEAPAILSVVETKDTVVTALSAAELSEAVALTIDVTEGNVYLFPVVVHAAVMMILVAAGDVSAGSLETACEAAGMRLEVLALERVLATKPEPRTAKAEAGGSTIAGRNVPKWEHLTPEERGMHLRAQRFAQVAVARMRLEHRASVESGRRQGDLYAALRGPIDEARETYRRQFFTGDHNVQVDYLYLELLRSLADDQDRMLGAGFPGRLT